MRVCEECNSDDTYLNLHCSVCGHDELAENKYEKEISLLRRKLEIAKEGLENIAHKRCWSGEGYAQKILSEMEEIK